MLPFIFHPVLIEANLLTRMLIFRYLELPVLTEITFIKKCLCLDIQFLKVLPLGPPLLDISY